MHYAEPHYPFDTAVFESSIMGFNQASARLFVVPSSLGIEARILNGYVYLSANSVTDDARGAPRRAVRGACRFLLRALGRARRPLVREGRAEILEVEALEVPELPEAEEYALVA